MGDECSGKGRYRVFQFTSGFVGDSDRQYGIEDLSYQRDNILRDWHSKGRYKKPWKGTIQEATALAIQLNRNPKREEVSDSQKNRYANAARKKSASNKPTVGRTHHSATIPTFKKCKCGARYKGEQHCA